MLNETQIILNRLAVADREHQKEAGGRLLLRSVKYLCAAVLAAFILDVVFHLSAGWRLGLLLAVIFAIVVLVLLGWQLAFVRRNRLEHIARFLETRDPALGSRLINLLQLSGQTRDDSLAPPTRELARQAVENYAAGLGQVPVEALARTGEVRRHLKRAAWALLMFAGVLAAGFHITTIEAARFADPFGDHPAYSFTTLQIRQPGPAGTNVLYGKSFIVKVKAAGHRPREVFLTSFPVAHPEAAVTLPMFDDSGSGYNQLLDNVRTELVVFAHTKDHTSESKQVRIGVVLTPQLERTFVQITPPEYTGLKAAEKLFDFKGVQALAGGTVKFRLQSNRPLREGWLEITAGDQPARRIGLKKSAENEVSGSFIATESGRLKLGIVDVAGLPSSGDRECALTVTHDLPPEIRLVNPEQDAFVALDFKLQAQIEAGDDYGLREIRLHRGLNGVYSAPKIFRPDKIVLSERETVEFNFASLGIQPGDVVSLFAEAVDNAPQPHVARSQTVRLAVISVEDYNNYLREQNDIAGTAAKYAELDDDLKALIEKQKVLGEAAQKLNDQFAMADAKQREALTQQLDRLLAQQNELNEQLNQQAGRMEHFVRDQPLYDVEKDLQEMLREQAGNIRLSTQDNHNSARDIAQRSSPPSGPRKMSPDMLNDFKQASDDQIARLEPLHEAAEQQMVQKLDDLAQMQELLKDFNLFESLYRTQQDLAQQAQAYNRPGQLSREDQLALKNLAATEKAVADTLNQLQEKLRADAEAAEKLFPKAAQSGRDLAEQIGRRRMEPLASQATGQMLAGGGEQSFQLADRLREEMEKLFGECQGGNCPSGDELDDYLRLQHLKPGNNFAQLARSRKFGFGQGKGFGIGLGEGLMGASGYAVMGGSNPSVMGNESSARNGNSNARQSGKFGQGAGGQPGGSRGDGEKPDVLQGLNPVNRQSAAAASATVIEEYNDVVDNYFKAITTRKEKSSP